MTEVVDLTGTPPIERPWPVVALIPFKGKLEMTRDLVDSLRGEGVPVITMNNGDELDQVGAARQLEMPGAGIHRMWNAGLEEAHGLMPGAHVAILNNDIRLSPHALPTIGAYLDRHWDVMLVSPNYDERSGEGEDQVVHGICAGRYDGTGGIAGFAMVLANRWAKTYRFDERLTWWFGDNDLALEVERYTYGKGARIHLGTTVEHLDGGSQTAGDWFDPKWAEVLAEDEKIFKAKWGFV